MDEPRVLIPDYVPPAWEQYVAEPRMTCACPSPAPHTRAERKGAARTYCDRCGLPVRLELVRR
jgi:hypothetical protein